MTEILTTIGELIAMEIDDVSEVSYSKVDNNSFVIIMQDGQKYLISCNQLSA